MANYSKDDLFSTVSKSLSLKSDHSFVNEENSSWKYLAKTYFNNSKQLKNSISNIFIKENYYKNLPGAIPISMNQMLKAQNTNAPWLFNILKKKFQRSRKHKKVSKEKELNKAMIDHSRLLAEELLEKPISSDGTSGKWIVEEKEIVFPLIKVCE
jgi:hypothetical protein